MKIKFIWVILFAGIFFTFGHTVAGQEEKINTLEVTISKGDWGTLASNSVDGPVGHFCRAVANGGPYGMATYARGI